MTADRARRRRDDALVRVSRYLSRTHTGLFRLTRGRLGNTFAGGRQVLFLTVRGRRSGRHFTTPLLHIRDEQDFVVAASNGGIDREPQWWLNLRADPRATIEVRGRRVEVLASEVDGDARADLWRRLLDFYPGYADYQADVRRRVAVVRLRPAVSP